MNDSDRQNRMKNKRRVLMVLGIVLAAALYVVGILILPDTIGMQIQMDGSLGNVVSKYLGLLAPLSITILGSVTYYREEKSWALPVALLGIALFIVTYWLNLR